MPPQLPDAVVKRAIRMVKDGMPQVEVAEILKVSPSTVSRWWREHEERNRIECVRERRNVTREVTVIDKRRYTAGGSAPKRRAVRRVNRKLEEHESSDSSESESSGSSSENS